MPPDPHEFDEAAKAAVYRAIFSRRDVRGQFLPNPVPDEILARILVAAHNAPSVGFMQPWNFIVVRSPEVKRRLHAAFSEANAEAEGMFEGDRRPLYRSLKLEGILESPVGVCVTCDRERTGRTVLGRTHMKEMDVYSTVCAVQNLWLAARAEGLGLGWVSIFKPDALRAALGIPERIVPIGYFCIGYVQSFQDKPELETAGWLPRSQLKDLVYLEGWEHTEHAAPLLAQIAREQAARTPEPRATSPQLNLNHRDDGQRTEDREFRS